MLTTPSHLLEPDTILPSQFFATRRRDALQKKGEYRLLVAVLEDAIACYQKYALSIEKRDRRAFEEVEQWIMDAPVVPPRKDDYSFSFEQICGVLGLDPAYMRHGLQKWRDRRIAAADLGNARVRSACRDKIAALPLTGWSLP
jgi:hypothetical protein